MSESSAVDPSAPQAGVVSAVSVPSGDVQPQRENLVLTIGDIGVSRSWVVTPNGPAPLQGSQWIVRDMSRTESKIPTWAIVMAILLFVVCFIGLLFLLVKERTTVGYVEVTVHSGSVMHTTQIPVSDPVQIAQVRQLVAQAQTMTAALR